MPEIDLVWLTPQTLPPEWPLGEVILASPTLTSINKVIEERSFSCQSEAWLFWDGKLGVPEKNLIADTYQKPGHVWHAGLKLGMGGLPAAIDFVAPTWMLNRDPEPDIESTSWRLSLRCCLIKTEVLRKMGGLKPGFQTLEAAVLEMGHRFIRRGVIMRHVPTLLNQNPPLIHAILPFADELLFIYYRFGRHWTRWALMRALLSKNIILTEAWRAWRTIKHHIKPKDPPPFFNNDNLLGPNDFLNAKVSVLIPTLDRYPYLRTVLNQLRQQTVQPKEIIVIDQTSPEQRDLKIKTDFADLPLKLIYLNEAGQCISRNAGLKEAAGDFILFLDDDDEVEPQLIAKHLLNITKFKSEVSAGVALVPQEENLPEEFTYIRTSDVFPTNNSLINKNILLKSGLFDLAYNKLPRADGDLGMRIYLSGALMILNPKITVIHHHAPRGGLRQHKARVITYASSRRNLTHRHLPSKSEIYLEKRYFTPRQVNESLWLRAFGTFSLKGSWWRRVLKICISGLLFPATIWQIRQRIREADEMLKHFPVIPRL